jgi:hypothetical protein
LSTPNEEEDPAAATADISIATSKSAVTGLTASSKCPCYEGGRAIYLKGGKKEKDERGGREQEAFSCNYINFT